MPLYDYACPRCGHSEEVLHPRDDEAIITCECGETLVKQMSAPAFRMYNAQDKIRAIMSDGSKVKPNDEQQ